MFDWAKIHYSFRLDISTFLTKYFLDGWREKKSCSDESGSQDDERHGSARYEDGRPAFLLLFSPKETVEEELD